MKYELRTIDSWSDGDGAWSDGDGNWTWNDSRVIGKAEFADDATDEEIISFLIKNFFLACDLDRVIVDDGAWPILEIQDASTFEPLLAFIGE